MKREKREELETMYPELVSTSAKNFLDGGNGYLARLRLEIDFDDPCIVEQTYANLRHAAIESSSFNGMEAVEAERFYPTWEEAAMACVVLPLPDQGGDVHTDHFVSEMLASLDAKIDELEKEKTSEKTGTASEQKTPATIDQDPYMRLDFARKLMTYQEEVIGVCWDMKEHLEAARPYMNSSKTYLTLIEQMIGMTAEIQKLADHIRALGEREIKHANYLIHLIEDKS